MDRFKQFCDLFADFPILQTGLAVSEKPAFANGKQSSEPPQTNVITPNTTNRPASSQRPTTPLGYVATSSETTWSRRAARPASTGGTVQSSRQPAEAPRTPTEQIRYLDYGSRSARSKGEADGPWRAAATHGVRGAEAARETEGARGAAPTGEGASGSRRQTTPAIPEFGLD